jgi:hypothetical protein
MKANILSKRHSESVPADTPSAHGKFLQLSRHSRADES